MMKRSKWLTVAAVIGASMTLAGVALATVGTGSVVSTVVGQGAMDTGVGFAATPGTNTIVTTFEFGPNSSTGWHSHPGKALVTVQSGTFTVYHARECEPIVYEAGDAFVENPATTHVGRNETTGTVTLATVFFNVPLGENRRIDQPQPSGCEIT